MTTIDRVGPKLPPRPAATAAGSSGGGFVPPSDARADAAAAPPVALSGPVTLESLLALQQVDDATAQDRQARDHGRRLLRELGGLQAALLGSGGLTETLGRIGALADALPAASDPELAVALAQVVLRARIELARHGG
jgi:hypothetical protein